MAVVTLTAAPAFAEGRAINIEPQSLASALREFASQSQQAILVSPALADNKTSQGVHDTADPEMALAQLLQGTGLTWRRSGEALLIVDAADPQSGSAAGDGADAGTVQALIVTAQKREENIQDVPIAMSAFTQEDLTRSQVAGGPDLMTQVPNMTFTKTNFSSYSIQIRGIGTQAISATVDPAVAVAFNNTPFVRNRFFEQEFYDLQRVEVLRGPQGTLYGRNATAGVVNIISQKPKFTYEAKLSADVANYKSTRLEGMINLPLVDDKVALRLAGAWTKRDGFVTNEITGNPIDGRDLWSTRLSLRVTPTDRLDANLIWEHFQEDDDRLRSGKQLCHKDIVTEVGGVPVGNYDQTGAGAVNTQQQYSQGCKPVSLYAPESFETPNGLTLPFYGPLGAIGLPIAPGAVDPYLKGTQSRDLRVIESTVDPSYKAKSDTVELQLAYKLTDTLSINSETAWATDFVFSTEDYNRFNTKPGAWAQSNGRPNLLNNGVFCDPQIGCADRLVAIDLSTAKSRHFSQEFRLASDFDGPFNFSVGANFLRYDTVEKYYVFANAFTLWGATDFQTAITTPWIPGVSQNLECLRTGFDPVDLNDAAGVPVTGGGCLYIDPNPLSSLNDLGHNYFLSKNPYKLLSYAVFGEAYYNITEDLKLTAGLRWTVDRKQAPRIPSWVLATGVGYPVSEVVKQEWREPTGRLTLDWKPDLSFTEQSLFYASYAHGYKAGGANPPPAAVALNVNTGPGVPTPSDTHPLTFDAEYVDAFEVGTKNVLLDGKLTLNATGFYYDYKGYQLSQIVDRSAITKNFDADIWGLELETDWRPLENLRLGFKGGYENTRVADGMKAVDVMDRTAGHTDWIVVKPFPLFPSNCILPVYLAVYDDGGVNGVGVHQIGNGQYSSNGPCNMPYFMGLDPITFKPYVANPPPENADWFYSNGGGGAFYPNYPGFDPASAPNNGEGFSKDLSGKELPNAPHFTATITADYTVPLPQDWLMTLHADLYGQSEAWTRIFNTEGYDKLKAYSNINIAAIFTNEDAGWNVMAYVKNVLDHDSITGAFLNSDDSGLTTNVFLNEPRLYGLRVTKEFSGGPWWTGANADHTPGEPYPLTVEIGGQVQRQDAPYAPLMPTYMDQFSPALQPATLFNRDLDHGDGREVKVTWRPAASAWSVSAGIRYGRTNGGNARLHLEELGNTACAVPESSPYFYGCGPDYVNDPYFAGFLQTPTNTMDAVVSNREDHQIIDFQVSRDAGLGALGLERSVLGFGLRYAQFNSRTTTTMDGIPDWNIPDGWFYGASKYPSTATRYSAVFDAEREFKGSGPVISWDGAKRLGGDDQTGHTDVEWTISGGALFGKQTTAVVGEETVGTFSGTYNSNHRLFTNVVTPVNVRRSQSATVPMVSLSAGLSYEVQRVKIGAGYRWERYSNALDGGFAEHKSYDRTFDGPYFKVAVGFGG